MNLLHVLLHLPDLLESFATKLAGELLLVDFTLLTIVNMLNVRCDVVAVEEALAANIT